MRQRPPPGAPDAPVKVFVVQAALVRRAGEVIGRRRPVSFDADGEPAEDLPLGDEAVEHPLLQLARLLRKTKCPHAKATEG